MNEKVKAIRKLTDQLASGTRRLEWNLRRTSRDSIHRLAEARVAEMKATSEPFRRMPKQEHERIVADIVKEEAAARSLTAAVARYQVEPHIAELDDAYKTCVAECRRDVLVDMPEALHHLDAGAMLSYHLLLETLRPQIEKANPAELLARHKQAIQTKDARSHIEASLIEERAARAAGLAETAEQLSAAKELRNWIDGIQEMRVPIEHLSDVEATVAHARKQIAMADLAQVRAINTEHPNGDTAAKVFEAEGAVYTHELAAAGGQ